MTQVLEEIAILLELKNENPFKVRAYLNASRALQGCPEDLATLLRGGRLKEIKGIGEGIFQKIQELSEKGRLPYYEELKKSFPKGLLDLLDIQGLGPKRAQLLYQKLKIDSIEKLERACQDNKLLHLEGFGAKSQANLLQGIQHLKKSAGHFLISFAKKEAESLQEHLRKQEGILQISLAGSIRRHKEIIRDIDILVAAKKTENIHAAFTQYPPVDRVLAHGDTKSSIILNSGIHCDLRTVRQEEFPFALHYFTGSKEHNVSIRSLAKDRGFKINEYGLFKGARRIRCLSEEAIFQQLGLHYIPPELREDCGEFEAARKGPLPKLLERQDIRGVFHVHSTYSDGTASLEEMIRTAQALGYEYVGISDHSQSAKYAHGLEPERLKKQRREIETLSKKFRIRIFWGTECDILSDGRLDYPDPILQEFDFVIGSVHSHFQLPEKEQTERLLRAMDSKHLTFLGHPTGRLLLGREGYRADLTRVIDSAAEKGVSIELNANPHRLDLDWRMLPYAKKKEVSIGIHPDAHSTEGLKDTDYGVGIARKGWLEKKDVVNTLSVKKVEEFLKKRRR